MSGHGEPRPTTAAQRGSSAPASMDHHRSKVEVNMTAQMTGDDEDPDAGMFSFMPPVQEATEPSVSGQTAASPLPLDQARVATAHEPMSAVDVQPLSALSDPDSTMSPAAAYALAAQHGALDGNLRPATSYRQGWTKPEMPDGRFAEGEYDESRDIQFGESRRTSEGTHELGEPFQFATERQIPPGTAQSASPFAYRLSATAVQLTDFGGDGGPGHASDDDKSPIGDLEFPVRRHLEEEEEYEDDDEDEDSPYPEVRASVSNYDDPTTPCVTFRTILLGFLVTVLVSAANAYLYFRYPAPLITPIVVQLITYPAGKFLAWTLPTREFRLPKICSRMGLSDEFSLNPGWFNIKEHTVLVIIANVATGPAYGLNFMITAEKFYDISYSFGFDILFILTTQIAGFGVAGLCRRFLVWPAAMIWPQNLVYCTLLNTLHAEDENEPGGRVSRFRFLTYVLLAAFCYYFIPGFLFQALSAFSFVCWAAPNHLIVNQLFGVNSGLGMSGLTLDWAQVSYIGSPLVIPWWAIVNIFTAFVVAFWVLAPILYYNNVRERSCIRTCPGVITYVQSSSQVWDSAYLPISTSAVFDRFGAPYNTSIVINKATLSLDFEAYQAYSPMYLPITYAIFYGVGLMTASALIVHTAFHHGPDIVRRIKASTIQDDDIHMKLMRVYKEVPEWWYLIVAGVALGLSICAVAAFDTRMPVWGVILALALSTLYTIPGGFVYALANVVISINLVTQIVGGYLFPGQPLANMIFKTYAAQSLNVTLAFVSDLKLGHYQKIPPRITFYAQLSSTFLACFVQVGVKRLLVSNVPDFCSPTQASHLICPGARVFYSSSIVWGLIGPQRIIGVGAYYSKLLWWLLPGVLLPIVAWLAARRFPRSFAPLINFPVALVGIQLVPPATGINYASWFLAGFVFQYLLRRHRFLWWSKYNFVLSAGLDSGTIIGGIVIFLALVLPKGGTIFVDWWGNTVFTNTLDFLGNSFKVPPEEGFGRTTWN
ncbi:BZ3500_MvSof-1268-A1-R1_Chr8-1g09935 [Microbotryum saponariae]|uniref:BZ3500_MvSof-1268-A1-R1_Chr8-1g09935 protein n=1 Tax=Microbotryum saponariae TaxID=289078 RepID=A0A2X0LM54_9BASI|nr:BZ3500_MvSof-1268-A1-R1_Chr8-1g09935 [Microbotryum saponariae]SDA08221.1 BZ3501_MvSof-1269-A2-R1_Chr8-1g09658 [Microbotryum saponariae]